MTIADLYHILVHRGGGEAQAASHQPQQIIFSILFFSKLVFCPASNIACQNRTEIDLFCRKRLINDVVFFESKAVILQQREHQATRKTHSFTLAPQVRFKYAGCLATSGSVAEAVESRKHPVYFTRTCGPSVRE